MNPTIVTHHIEFFDFFLRIIVAMLCGFGLGFERQWINRAAGIQTNVLVCSGACIFILASYFVSYEGQTASRIAAQIVSGVGFLGAGMIFRDGVTTHGINTAATIWCAAATGVLCGMGLMPYALGLTFLLVIGNVAFRKFDHIISKNRKWMDLRVMRTYEIQVMAPKDNSKDLRTKILGVVNTNDHHIFSVKTSFAKQDYVKITVSFSTHSVDYEKVQMVSEQIEEFDKDLIVDWSQINVK
jgi:putative Mg2+ transporter-C (MgtC) family protein